MATPETAPRPEPPPGDLARGLWSPPEPAGGAHWPGLVAEDWREALGWDGLWQQDVFSPVGGSSGRHWSERLQGLAREALSPARHGHWPTWQAGWAVMPSRGEIAARSGGQNGAEEGTGLSWGIDGGAVALRQNDADDGGESAWAGRFNRGLAALGPWRKGPWDFYGTRIDTEWRSDWKWERLWGLVGPLLGAGGGETGAAAGLRVLDIGAGNGYYLWRWLAAGAGLALGVDPFLAYFLQFSAGRRYFPALPAWLLPVGIEALDGLHGHFDVVTSLGVIYHRVDPAAHLADLLRLVRPGGLVVVESITVAGPAGYALRPPGRYAAMGNVHWLPTPSTLEIALREAGLTNVVVGATVRTTAEEQRTTPWMPYHSLRDFLHPTNPLRTIEGHPAPERTIAAGRKSN